MSQTIKFAAVEGNRTHNGTNRAKLRRDPSGDSPFSRHSRTLGAGPLEISLEGPYPDVAWFTHLLGSAFFNSYQESCFVLSSPFCFVFDLVLREGHTVCSSSHHGHPVLGSRSATSQSHKASLLLSVLVSPPPLSPTCTPGPRLSWVPVSGFSQPSG